MSDKQLILVVEDEPELAKLVEEYLQAANYQCKVILDGLEAEQWLNENEPDLIILDIMLPGKDGISLCKDIRGKRNTPIIMATAKVEEIDRLIGLELGADDYLCKPYSPRELVARTKAVLRRANSEAIEGEPLLIDPETHSVKFGKQSISLTAIELRLLEFLHKEPGKIFSRQQLMDNIYNDYRIVSDRTVDSHVKKLRKKIHEVDPSLELIHSIYGVGYKFEYPHD